jgi:hypothetical protein
MNSTWEFLTPEHIHFLLISFKKSDGAILKCWSRSSWSYLESLDGRKRNSGIPHDVLT